MEIQKHGKSWKSLALLFIVFVLAVGTPVLVAAPQNVSAAVTKNGWVESGSNRYYYKNGVRVENDWVKSGNYWYFLDSNGVMVKGEFITHNNNKYYLTLTGKMVTGWRTIRKNTYYFNSSGAMQIGFCTIDGKRYYIKKKTGILMKDKVFRSGYKTFWAGEDGSFQTGFNVVSGKKYYFTPTGAKRNGWHQIGKYWYLMDEYGACKTGWQTVDGKKYYMIKSGKNMGIMLGKGVHTISKKQYMFDSSGALLYEVGTPDSTDDVESGGDNVSDKNSNLADATSAKTVKNYLLNALKPVGSTLYVWGGGWAEPTTNYKGLYPTWKKWYNSNSGSYNYANYKDLSVATRKKGLDCSGFVGWTTYQIMQQKSGGPSYVAEASTLASYYAGRGYGTLKNQSALSKNGYKGSFKAGDIGSRPGHTWIVLGQCSDGSVVIVHSTPPCVQIAGTPTPTGSYSSQAVTLAKKYMQKYYSSTVSKFGLGSKTSDYIRTCNIMRWNTGTLSDPDGFRSKNAAQILAELFDE